MECATNVAGYICWGEHSELGQTYAIDGTVKWSGQSSWWIIETIESFNGTRGDAIRVISSTGFQTMSLVERIMPVGAISSVEEPSTLGVCDPKMYFGLWAAGKNFAVCAWNSRRNNMNAFQAVGDPFVTY